MIKAGFIGTGNMGSALAEAVAFSNEECEIYLSNRSMDKAAALKERIIQKAEGINFANADFSKSIRTASNEETALECKYIFLGVKPQMMKDMLLSISGILKKRSENGDRYVLVTMAAGLETGTISEYAGTDAPVIRIMPNTPAAIGEGVILYSLGEGVTEEEEGELLSLLKNAGLLSRLDEKLIDAGSAVSGCGPAFVYMFIEAMADGGVLCGLRRDDALKFAAKTLAGAAGMVLNGGHPGTLKDAVCSPGGTTIEGVKVLEERSLRGAVIDAVKAAYEKNAKLK